jgi:hypothetical protein
MPVLRRAWFPCLKPETYREACIPKVDHLFQEDRTKLQAGCDYHPPFQTLNILAGNLLFLMKSALTLGGAEWLNATKRIGANCVLL